MNENLGFDFVTCLLLLGVDTNQLLSIRRDVLTCFKQYTLDARMETLSVCCIFKTHLKHIFYHCKNK